MEWRSSGKHNGARQVPALPGLIEDKCKACGLCVEVCPCPVTILSLSDNKLNIEENDMCAQCGHCVAVCPTGALFDKSAAKDETPTYTKKSLPTEDHVLAFFRARRSIRHYKDKPVSREHLEKIIEAGKYAPTAGNRQEVYFVVIDDPAEVEKLRGIIFDSVYKMFKMLQNKAVRTMASLIMDKSSIEVVANYLPILDAFRRRWEEKRDDRLFYHAPAIMLVHGPKWDDTVDFSCAAVLYQSSLMAQTLGIGCCFNGFLQVAINKDAKVKKRLGIPKRHKCYGAMGLGYTDIKYKRFVRRNPLRVTWY